MIRSAAQYVPPLLTEDQKQSGLNASGELAEQIDVDPGFCF